MAVKKAIRMLGLIKRNFHNNSNNTAIQKSGYTTLRILLSYFNKDSNLIECFSLIGFQRRATKTIQDIKHLSYPERLEILGLSRLVRGKLEVT